MLSYTVRTQQRRIRVEDYLRDYVDVPRCHQYCRQCGCYATNWACPPFAFDPLAMWRRYRWLHLIAFRLEFTPDQLRSALGHEELVDQVLKMFHAEKRRAQRMLMALRAAVPDSMPLGAGQCRLCPVCTRKSGEPCRMPDQLAYSIESMGGDVEGTMRMLFDDPVVWSDGSQLPDHYLVVVGLLCDQDELPEPDRLTSA